MYKKRIRLLSLLIAVIMLLPVSAFANPVWEKPAEEASDLHEFALEKIGKMMAEQERPKIDEDIEALSQGKELVLMIELNDEPVIKEATRRGIKVSDLSSADAIARDLLLQQDLLEEEIRAMGIEFEKEFNYTNVINAISIRTDISNYGLISELESVKSIAISNEYYAPEERAVPRMLHSHEMIDDYPAWEKGYKGQGTIVAVLDTGIDVNNQDMNLTDKSKIKLDETQVRNIIEEIGHGAYYNDKIPFGYNYFNHNNDVYCYESEHGLHVSGTVAANGRIKGVAPEAQILAMKVFSNDPLVSSTGDYQYVKAFDDSIKLGADVINMSLGGPKGFYRENDLTNIAISNATENGIIFAISAGNEDKSIANPTYETPDYGIVGSPSVYKDAVSIASINNNWISQTDVIEAGDKNIAYGVSGKASMEEFIGKECEIAYAGLGYKYVSDTDNTLVPIEEEYANIDLDGKFVLMQRGQSTFTEKILGAQERGAIGAIIFNSEAGGDAIMGMLLDDSVKIPALFIGLNDGLYMKKLTSIKFGQEKGDVRNPAGGEMSDFSSWGPTPSLNLKPELTAPGGSIYSNLNDNKYASWNGTSMAAPHVSGAMAILNQYINENPRLNTLNINSLEKFVEKTDLPKNIYLIGDRAYSIDLINTEHKNILTNAIIQAFVDGTEIFRYSKEGQWYTYSGQKTSKHVSGNIYYTNEKGREKLINIGDSSPIVGRQTLTVGDTTRLSKILLMNTAEPVIDPDNYPYSPRKQGAGILQVNRAIETPVVLVDARNNEPKVELFDFDEKEFTLNLRAINTTETDQSYNLETIVIQDYIDEEGRNYKVSDFVDADIDAEEIITVPAGGYKDFSIKVDFSKAKSIYEGMFIEGFVRLKHTDGKTPTIGLPYLGYYGSWSDAPIIDSFDPDRAVFAIGANNKWGGAYIGELYNPQKDTTFVDLLGNPDGSLMTEEYAYISNNPTEYTKVMGREKIGVLFALLRNAEHLQIGIRDENNRDLGNFYNEKWRRKNDDTSGRSHPYFSLATDFLFNGKFGREVLPDGKYEYVIKAKAHYPGARFQEVSKAFRIDGTKPTVTDVKLNDGLLTFSAKDDGAGLYAAYVSITEKNANRPIAKKEHLIQGNGIQTIDLRQELGDVDQYFVNIIVVDRVGNYTEVSSSENAEETERPYLIITEPDMWSYVDKTVMVKGHVFDLVNMPKVEINGKEAKVWYNSEDVEVWDGDTLVRKGNPYSFELEISFDKEGLNTIKAIATSITGEKFEFTRDVFVDKTPPELKVDYDPVVSTDTAEITVSFSDKTSTEFKMYVNGRDFGWYSNFTYDDELEGTSFTEKVKLNLEIGENIFDIVIVDMFGNEATETIKITRLPEYKQEIDPNKQAEEIEKIEEVEEVKGL